jgi:hypothetical protein
MPDDERTDTEYVITSDNEFKFMLSEIKNDKLTTIQFNGTKTEDDIVKGTFTAMIDGELRDDMSGDFSLKRK